MEKILIKIREEKYELNTAILADPSHTCIPNKSYIVLGGVRVFSSVSCGRRNSEQTNYDMINSIMERIVKKDFPELAIEWGAVGDAGLIADMQN
ncbi:hypothetical protein HZH66_003652 [Vespula vulgaris]|uniref:Uncharacterized protein n=1 Tax=Vespula vulgaris TaxID=7454 RepID=A0A834KIM9_VESVU|nr:hypothetical protein HZH66_003652 [Vespula vulgaris]